MLTNQEIFTKAWNGLKGQGFAQAGRKAASDTVFQCLYLAPNGHRCAVGHVLPEGSYTEDFEGRGGGDILAELKLISAPPRFMAQTSDNPEYRATQHFFVYQLQNLHDSNGDPVDMEAELRIFAEKYNLTIPA